MTIQQKVAQRAKHPAVREVFAELRSYAKERSRYTPEPEQAFFMRAAALKATDVLPAAQLAVDVGVFHARGVLLDRREYSGALHLYLKLVGFLLSHGVWPDDCYRNLLTAV